MSADYQGAMPQLYGAPAYPRPSHRRLSERPLDPDDLPLEVHRTEADYAILSQMSGLSEDEDEYREVERPSLLRRSLLAISFGGRRP